MRALPGSRELVATVCGDNERAVSLLARVSQSLQVRWRGGERELVGTYRELTPPGISGAAVSRLIRRCRSRCLWQTARAGPSG